MARVTKKSRGNRYKIDLNEKELNTLTIALALLDIPTMEQELKEQGLPYGKAEYDHLTLFKTLTDVNGLYRQVQLPDENQQEDETA
ncbi:hypothetical protein M5X00_26005 [Paenibacillus alvei]|uniref:hypothetical protein n=1 Tax=Paenibacillus alvei TaxID=44250 RepID=UPI00228031FD|nr:hypothetical protein [Paenibacillus alvei]MCY9757685.1 hypothetical protein [Paenibacillus alvei]